MYYVYLEYNRRKTTQFTGNKDMYVYINNKYRCNTTYNNHLHIDDIRSQSISVHKIVTHTQILICMLTMNLCGEADLIICNYIHNDSTIRCT